MFQYERAFSRNIGWITKEEQQVIRKSKVAIGGLGGAGGEHALTLARMGFENFHLSDFDEYEVHNFNRQAGAFLSTAGKPKCNVMANMIRDINPNANITEFPEGLNESNIDDFFHGIDVYIDGIDFFAKDARLLVYRKAHEKGIPNLLAAPLGMGMAMVCFTKDSMNFDDYYKFSSCRSDEEFFIKLLIGLSPALLHTRYLVDPTAANFKEQRGPSTPMGIKLCSGILVSQVVKLILGRGEIVKAPSVLQFDAYRNKFVKSWSPFGNAGLIQRIKYFAAKKAVS